jgi:protein TonB
MKQIIKITFTLLFVFLLTCTFAQNKELDKTPEVVGGSSAIAKNIVYPKTDLEEGNQGKVFVKATINKEGKVIKCKIERSVSKSLDQAAIDAIKKTEFTPGIMNGEKVEAEVTIPIMFKLK